MGVFQPPPRMGGRGFVWHCDVVHVIHVACRVLCRELGPSSLRLVEAFGIPDHLAASPIASDWAEYNKVDNRGELLGEF